jgi:hypothetical protein
MMGQNDGNRAISSAPAASAATATPTSARFDRRKVNEPASRRLRENSCDPAHRERKPDALFVPLVAGEVNREERPHPRLHVGEKEIEPIEAKQRSPRRGPSGLR